MLVFLYDLIDCDVISVQNFYEIFRYFFQIRTTPPVKVIFPMKSNVPSEYVTLYSSRVVLNGIV